MATPASTSQGERSEPATVDFSFCATADSPRNLITILSAFHYPGKKKKLFCNVTPSARGIDMMWEEAKSLQAHVFLSKELFTDYRVRDQQQSFKISLTDFLEILQIFPVHASSSGPAILLGHKMGSNSLWLQMKEGSENVSTDVGLVISLPDPISLFDFRGSQQTNEVIVGALSELDWSSEVVSVLLSNAAPYFRISTTGPSGSCEFMYPKDSEVFSEFKCSHTMTSNYTLRRLQAAVKALQYALRTKIRMNQDGLLSMAHMVKHEDSNRELQGPDGQSLPIFVEFFLLSNDSAGDDDA